MQRGASVGVLIQVFFVRTSIFKARLVSSRQVRRFRFQTGRTEKRKQNKLNSLVGSVRTVRLARYAINGMMLGSGALLVNFSKNMLASVVAIRFDSIRFGALANKQLKLRAYAY